MLQTIFRRITPAVLVSLLFTLTFGLCDWYNACFAGTGTCTTDNCGVGCYITSYGADQGKCYTSAQAECCICWFRLDTCDCVFGPGTQRVAIRYLISWTPCNVTSGSCGVNCVGYEPPPIML